MADAFWEPIFSRLIDDPAVLVDIIRDTPDPVLIGLARKNPALWRVCNPLVKGKTITSHERFLGAISDFAQREAALRKVLFYEWVHANPRTLEFPTLPVTAETRSRLESGEFGTPLKIAILARIDPRESAKPVLDEYLSIYNKPAPPVPGALSPEIPSDTAQKLREELREVRKKLKEGEDRESVLHAKLSERGERLAELEKTSRDDRTTAAALTVRLESLTAALAAQTAPQAPHSPAIPDEHSASELRDRISALETRCRELEEALARRTATGERLESELEETRRTRTDSDTLAKQFDRLRDDHRRLEKLLNSYQRAVPARLLTLGPDPETPGASLWIAEAPGLGRIIVPGRLTAAFNPVETEWILVTRDETGEAASALPIETEWKREFIGILRSDDFGWSIHCDDMPEALPLLRPCPGFTQGDVVSALVLPEFAERKRVAVSLKRLSAPQGPGAPPGSELRAGFSTIQRKLGLLSLDPPEFTRWLKQQEIPFVLEPDAIRFEQPYHGLLASLRPRLPTTPVCERDICREHQPTFPFPRAARVEEVCGLCREEIGAPSAPVPATETYDFGGQRVLIIGGDAVGTAYRELLARHNLNIEWLSGFVSLGGARQGFGDVSAIVVILKQVSHTMLRELTSAIRGLAIPLLYSSRRGTSGVLSLLVRHFKPGRKSAS
ncbi:MAG TPA: DUF2325 domain-containing protein [Candidatus Ozemobacteraceae bacterium]|nr:DUF2325 domain-containing protein [Candidatus Ozemobacteraceae bacterium]